MKKNVLTSRSHGSKKYQSIYIYLSFICHFHCFVFYTNCYSFRNICSVRFFSSNIDCHGQKNLFSVLLLCHTFCLMSTLLLQSITYIGCRIVTSPEFRFYSAMLTWKNARQIVPHYFAFTCIQFWNLKRIISQKFRFKFYL